MKKKSFIALTATLMLLTACQGATGNDTFTIHEENQLKTIEADPETYENSFLNDRLPNQWDNYGVGDPFIYKFNGYYYLLCSTKATEYGVKGWKSKDLYHWEQVDNGVSKKGFVVDPSVTESFDAYASEVYYLDGTFYLVESSHGQGHYVLSSKSPEGPFTVISDRLDESRIDGSMYMDINGKMVLMYAGASNINAKYFNDSMDGLSEASVIGNTSMAAWTEGPECITKNGTRFYFYTGNGVTQRAYRVDYSYAPLDSGLMDSDSIIQGHNVLLNTDDDFYGLGHCCVVSGPDLDSVYMGFHNLYREGTSEGRRFNLTRLLFAGNEVMTQHTGLYDNIKPTLPDYQVFDINELDNESDYCLSKESTKDSFTVEYNVKGNGKCVFSYQNDKNYGYVDFDGEYIKVHSVSDGKDKEVNKTKLYRKFNKDVIHTFKVGYKEGLMDLTFDLQEIANDVKVGTFSAGKVGYSKSYDFKGTLTFSNFAQGDSDKMTQKMENIPSDSYNPKLSNLSKASTVTKIKAKEDLNVASDSNLLNLNGAGDYATYVDYVTKDGSYGLDMVIPSSSYGKTVGVQVDGETIYRWTLPSYPDYQNFARVKLADLKLTKGNHNITIYNLGESFSYQKMYLEANYNVAGYSYEESLLSYPSEGISYPTFFNKDENGFYSDNSTRYLATFGNGTLEDLEMSCDIMLTGENGTGTCGLVLSADNWGLDNMALDNYKSIQGYYFAFNSNKVTIVDSNYQYSDESCRDIYSFDNDVNYNIKAVKQGKKLAMYVNDVKVLETVSLMGRTRGYCGLYSNFTSARFTNLKIKTL